MGKTTEETLSDEAYERRIQTHRDSLLKMIAGDRNVSEEFREIMTGELKKEDVDNGTSEVAGREA